MATYLELKQQAEQLLAKAEEARQKEVATAIEQIKKQMAEFGITLYDLKTAGADQGKAPAAANAAPSAPKYKGPNGELWAGGRGRKPDWALEVIAKEGEAGLEKYRIKP